MLGLGLATTLAWIVAPSVPATADCPAPEIVQRPSQVSPGGTIAIEGRSWQECNDTSTGCSFHSSSPYHGITLTLRPPGGRRGDIALDEVDADGDGRFLVRTAVPADAVPGTWDLIARVEGSQHFGSTVTFTVGER